MDVVLLPTLTEHFRSALRASIFSTLPCCHWVSTVASSMQMMGQLLLGVLPDLYSFSISSKTSMTLFMVSICLGKLLSSFSAQEKGDAETFTISGEKVVTAILRRHIETMNDVIEVYDEMLKLYKSGKTPSSNWPVICIDKANVLIQWKQGSVEKIEALSALLSFFCQGWQQYNGGKVPQNT